MLQDLRAFQLGHALAEVFCPEKPELLRGAPIGMYHCPCCGVMVLAGVGHPPIVLMDDGEYDYSWL